jgi:peptidoglycan/LPS O-acetylase OafA/YrhL
MSTTLAADIGRETQVRLARGSQFFFHLEQKKIPSLDGLRAVAVLLVIFHHLGIHYSPHGRGVLTFFVLSGFLITWLMLKESERYGEISIRDFYTRRVLRILPAFYVFWILHLAITRFVNGPLSRTAVLDYATAFFYVGNYWHAISNAPTHYLGHIWALCIEEQFYLLWPLVFAAWQTDLRKLTQFIVAGIIAVDVYRIVLFFGFHVSDNWLTFTFDSRIDHLLVGCLLAVLLKRKVMSGVWEWLTARIWISLVTLSLIVLSIALSFQYGDPYKYAVGFVLDPLLTAVLLVQVIAFSGSWTWGWLNWRITRYLGQISYSMFLFHVFANDLVKHVLLPHRSMLLVAPTAVALAAVMGTLSYYLVEQRFLRLKSKFVNPRRRDYRVSMPAAHASVASPMTIR